MHPGCTIEQVYLCRDAIDFRKAINGLSVMVEQEMGLNPFGSALYVFVNRSRNKIKVLYWHRNGFCLWQKRLEEDKFHWPKHPVGHFKIPHLWPPKIPQAGRADYELVEAF